MKRSWIKGFLAFLKIKKKVLIGRDYIYTTLPQVYQIKLNCHMKYLKIKSDTKLNSSK